jgi:Cu(I)/Ag(I) efflux system membrane protein CusA/SilA
MLWANGVGAEDIRPMASSGRSILVADEVIDQFLPVLFCREGCWRWHQVHARADGAP